MNENIQNLLLLMICFEFLEFFWQKGEDIKSYMQNLLHIYKNGVIPFACLHVSFFFILFCIFALDIKSPILFLIAIFKYLDISLKISLLNRLTKNLPLGNFGIIFENDYPISIWIKLFPLAIYTTIFYIALMQNFNIF